MSQDLPRKSDARKTQGQLNLIAKLHQRSVAVRVNEIDWKRGSSAPMVVEFDPTTACNLACPDCISRDLLNQGFFGRKRIRELTREMVDAGVKAVVLIGGGEPLAHPEIGWVIEYLGESNVQIGITTNGLLIDRYIDCIAKYASWVRVSMDAATPDTFQRIRPSYSGRSEFGKAVENMKTLAKIKTGKLGYSFMIYSQGEFDKNDSEGSQLINIDDDQKFSNVSEIYQGAVLAKEIGCDYYEVKPMYNIDHFSIIHRKELMKQAKGLIKQSLALEGDGFKVLQAAKLHHILNGESNIEPKDYTRCAVSQLRTLVTPSGTYVCPYFRGRGDKNIGNVSKDSFMDMWHGEQRAKVMDQLDPSKDCRMHCIRHNSNMFLEDMIAGKGKGETIEDFDLFI